MISKFSPQQNVNEISIMTVMNGALFITLNVDSYKPVCVYNLLYVNETQYQKLREK